MRKVSFETSNNKDNSERQEFQNSLIWLLNRLGTELILSVNTLGASENQIRVSSGLVYSACGTGAAIAKFTEELSILTRNALPLARAFYETCLSAAYVLTDNGNFAKRAELFSVYKTFKDQTKFFEAPNLKQTISAQRKIDRKEPIVRRAIEFFDNGEGARKRQCFEHSRLEMIDKVGAISSSAKVLFLGAEYSGYTLASEIAHGSYYAFQAATGTNNPQWSSEQISFLSTNIVVNCSEALALIVKHNFPTIDMRTT